MDFQTLVYRWVRTTLGDTHAHNREIRGLRFLEEAIELAQAVGVTEVAAQQLVTMVYRQPSGETDQEIGGCLITLNALGSAVGTDVESAGWTELSRIDTPEMRAKIFQRNQTKPRGTEA